MTITINDETTENGAISAKNNLHSIAYHITKISLLIGQAEYECDVECEEMHATLSELELAVNVGFSEIDEALKDYNSEQMHTESIETTGRI